jgi:ParB/RepB/Spo0J family partition protein
MFRKNMEELKSIPLESIIYSRYLSRQREINKNIEDLISNIKAVGLIQPILVFAIDDLQEGHDLYDSRKEFKGKYEILAGQRRYTAFQELNKQYPGEGFDKIPCHVRQPPDDELDAKAISIGENLTQLPMTMLDSINAVTDLYNVFRHYEMIQDKFGISKNLVRRYVKFTRLPKIVQDNIEEIHKNPKTAVNLALNAADLLNWTNDNDVSDELVLELAKRLAEKKRYSFHLDPDEESSKQL